MKTPLFNLLRIKITIRDLFWLVVLAAMLTSAVCQEWRLRQYDQKIRDVETRIHHIDGKLFPYKQSWMLPSPSTDTSPPTASQGLSE